MSTRKGHTGVSGEVVFYNNVLARLASRGNLATVAHELLLGCISAQRTLAVETNLFVGEGEHNVFCTAQDDGTETVAFNCGGNFDCTQFVPKYLCYSVFNQCNPPASFDCDETFECVEDFTCLDPNNFNCYEFSCGDAGQDSGSFNCDQEIDFVCSGITETDFDCHDDFDCKSRHGFFCTDDHDCHDNFDCTSKGMPNDECEEPYEYGVQGGPKPGDFLCGVFRGICG